MKSTGIIKSVDKLGRFKIPKELRTNLHIKYLDSLCISIVGRNQINISKVEDMCIFCNSTKNIHSYKDKNICEDCLQTISHILG